MGKEADAKSQEEEDSPLKRRKEEYGIRRWRLYTNEDK